MSNNIVELYSIELEGSTIWVGSNLDTRELGFYTKTNGIIIPVNANLRNQAIQTLSQESGVPNDEFKSMLEKSINDCINYNKKKGYSNSNLEKNARHLSISCEESELSHSEAFYDTLNNTFKFSLPRQYLELSGFLRILKAKTINQVISHEVGHMSVSDISIGSENNLIGNIGFLQMSLPIKISSKTADGNNYYVLDESQEIKENGARGLEELFNELENDERTNSSIAPDFAHRLDSITDGRLRFARQNHSLTDYYIIMQNIIESKDKAMLLLMGIEAYYTCVRTQDQEFAIKLKEKINEVISDYEIRKSSIKNQAETSIKDDIETR